MTRAKRHLELTWTGTPSRFLEELGVVRPPEPVKADDPVFAALTRPQMIGGVTYPYMVLNVIVTMEAFLVTRSFWALLIAATILYIPANLLPIMTVISLGTGEADTILSGVKTLIAAGFGKRRSHAGSPVPSRYFAHARPCRRSSFAKPW